jgi:DNA invertase Pin-like site-specific DNA recombinase
MGQVWGYVRVSTEDQNLALQVDALKAAGVPEGNIIQEKISGVAEVRPAFDSLLGQLEAGDVLVVWKLDRLGRSLAHLVEVMALLERRGVGFRSLTEEVSTTTPGGPLTFHIFAAVGQFERDLIQSRVNAGLKAARARGQALGRKPRLTLHQRREAARMIADGRSYAEAAATLGVGRSVVFRAVRETSAKERAQASSGQREECDAG